MFAVRGPLERRLRKSFSKMRSNINRPILEHIFSKSHSLPHLSSSSPLSPSDPSPSLTLLSSPAVRRGRRRGRQWQLPSPPPSQIWPEEGGERLARARRWLRREAAAVTTTTVRGSGDGDARRGSPPLPSQIRSGEGGGGGGEAWPRFFFSFNGFS